MEVEFDFANGAVTVFGDDKLSDVGGLKIVVVLAVIIWTVQKHN